MSQLLDIHGTVTHGGQMLGSANASVKKHSIKALTRSRGARSRVNWAIVRSCTCESIDQAGAAAEVSWEMSLSPCVTCWFTQLSSLTAQSRHRVFNCSVNTTPHPFSLYQCINSQGNTWLSPQCCVRPLSHFPRWVSLSSSVQHQEQERFYVAPENSS